MGGMEMGLMFLWLLSFFRVNYRCTIAPHSCTYDAEDEEWTG